MKKHLLSLLRLVVLAESSALGADPLDHWTVHWTQGKTLAHVAYAEERFVAVGEGGTIVSSTDGAQWSVANSGTSNDLSCVIYGNGQWVAVGGTTVVTSLDGNTWTPHDVNPPSPLRSVAYGNGQFVAVGVGQMGDNLGVFCASTNALDWTLRYSGKTNYDGFALDYFIMGNVVFCNGQYFAGGYAVYWHRPSRNYIFTSSDGMRWSVHESQYLPGHIICAAGSFASPQTHNFLYSSDGVSWTAHPMPNDIFNIGFGGGVFVVMGRNFLQSSTQGQTWTAHKPIPITDSTYLFSMTYGRGQFIAVGQDGVILQSDPLQPRVEPLNLFSGVTVVGQVIYVNANHCILEASTNLIDWSVILDRTNVEGVMSFDDPSSASYPRRFYRAKVSFP